MTAPEWRPAPVRGGVDAIPLLTKGRAEGEASNVDMNYFLGIRATDGVLVADFEEGATGASPGLNHPIAGVTPIAIAPANPTAADWHHAAVTYDGTTCRLYLDGVQTASLVVGVPPRADSIQHAGAGHGLQLDRRRRRVLRRRARRGAYLELRPQRRADCSPARRGEIPTATGLLGRWGFNDSCGPARFVGQHERNDLRTNWTWVAGAPFTDVPNAAPIVNGGPGPDDRAARARRRLTGSITDDGVSGTPLVSRGSRPADPVR